jgi:hypothetical protein
MVALFVDPFSLAFAQFPGLYPAGAPDTIFSLICTLLYACDVALNFFVAYYEDGVLVTDLHRIAGELLGSLARVTEEQRLELVCNPHCHVCAVWLWSTCCGGCLSATRTAVLVGHPPVLVLVTTQHSTVLSTHECGPRQCSSSPSVAGTIVHLNCGALTVCA